MNAAESVIEKFGGSAPLAKLIGKGVSTLSYWKKTGVIPARWQSLLLELAAQRSISLVASDFITAPPEVNLNPAEPQRERLPTATHWGELPIGNAQLPAYVLDDGSRVFSLKGVVVGLIGTDGGQLAEYLKVRALRDFLPDDLKPAEDGTIPALIRFDSGSGEGHFRYPIGLPVERFMDLCSAYSEALMHHLVPDNDFSLTSRQIEIAQKAVAFQRACAKVGIVAMVDEITGYQYERAEDALRLKLNLFLAEEMRKWDRTFPDQLWIEFGRLTKWHGPVHQRPKYWGKLVMELIYGYMDADVAKWLKENAPKPMHGQNYHQWLSSQYGLKRLTEHIWLVIGMSTTCSTMAELQERMGERFGRYPMQLQLYLPAPARTAA
jgi:hypothetical protein